MKRLIEKFAKVVLASLLAGTAVFNSLNPQPQAKAEELQTVEAANTSSTQMMKIDGEIDVQSIQEVQDDKQNVLISIDATSEDEGVKIHGIRAPDGSFTEGAVASYVAPCNGTYEFEIYYSKSGEELSQLYYEYVFDSDRMSDGNAPSKANGFLGAGDEMSVAAGPGTGTIYTKLYPYNVTIEGERMGPGNWHYVAYMQTGDQESIFCLEPLEDAGTDFGQYNELTEVKWSNELIRGNGSTSVTHLELSLIWFYAQIMGQKISNLSYSVDEWTFIAQIMIWSKLGYSVTDYDSHFQDGIDWVNNKANEHNNLKALTGTARMLEVWVNDPWPEGTETLDADRYVNKDGKVNTSGQWVPYDPDTTVLSFGDPKYIWGNYTINTEEQEVNGQMVTVITSITGGEISVRNKQSVANEYYPLYSRSSQYISVGYDQSDGYLRYDFSRKENLKEEVENVIFSTSQEQYVGTTYEYAAANLQRIIQFKMPEDGIVKLNIPFSEKPNAEVPEQPTPEKKPLKAPKLLKVDFDDDFPVEGATFTFHANETYQIHYQTQKTTCRQTVDGEECETGEWVSHTETVWSKGTEVMNETITPADGLIDTSPIIDNYYAAYDEKWAEIQEEWANKGSDSVSYDTQLDPLYIDKEGTGWIGGQFYAQEPDTSQNTCNSAPSGAGTCQGKYDGYLNLSPWEKILFEISENVSEDMEIIHKNERQRGRFTVHKVDGESAYLNHNNNHESQGDGYFYGSVFVVTAKEDIVLHNGDYAISPFTGNELTAGEVADVLVLQLPKNEDGSYDYEYVNNLSTSTTQMFDLGLYAVQEVRWPGVYAEDLPLIFDEEDQLWHVDAAQAEDVLDKLKDKNSVYYQFDYEKATDLYENGILPIDSPDGGYWFKDYTNGLENTTNADFVGGQTVEVSIEYVGQDKAYNEVIPNHNEKPGNVTVNGEEVSQSIPDENYAMTRGEDYEFTVNAGLDYENSIQKGHLQFKKLLTQKTSIENGDNTGVDDNHNVPAEDVYFAIYLTRKGDQTIQDTTEKPTHLPDVFFASKRMDGLEYVVNDKGNFVLYAEDKVNNAVTGYHEASVAEVAERKGLVMVYTDQTHTTMKPADNYYEWKLVDLSENVSAVMKLNTFVNPSEAQDGTTLTNQNLSDKDLYMVLKTNAEGKAGTNMPSTIVWANNALINGLINTEAGGSYGTWDYETALKYNRYHAETLAYLQKSGLPLPYGTYDIVELNAPEGYEAVSWKAEITKNLTTYDINDDATVWELGIEKGINGGYLSGMENPSGWIAEQNDVAGDGTQGDETWLNKQFHIFSDYVSTTTIGSNIEDKLHRQILQIMKMDAETGKTITYDSASFKLWQWNNNLALNDGWKHAAYMNGEWQVYYEVPEYDGDGNIISTTRYEGTEYFTDDKGLREILGQWVRIPAGSNGIYTTDAEGQITLSSPIPAADYYLLETEAPEGYLLNKQPIEFKVEPIGNTSNPNEGDYVDAPLIDGEGNFVCQLNKDCNNPDSTDYAFDQEGNVILENVQTEKVPNFITIIIRAEDMPQKGYVEVEKRGSIFDKFVQYVTDFVDLIGFKPTWKDDEVIKLNTTFCVYAEEDIVVNGDVKYEKDECIQKMTTNNEGHAFSEALYLGKYYVKECDAPHGYITNEEAIFFELTYDEQKTIVHPEFKEFTNDRQKFEIELNKTDENGQPLEGAVFGIYAAEDLPQGIVHEEDVPFAPTIFMPVEIMELEVHEDGTATLLGVKGGILTDETRYQLPSTVEVDGETYTLTEIASEAFAYSGLEGIVIPASIEFIGSQAFTGNSELDFVQFLGTDAPLFEASDVFPTGVWEEECTEDETGIVCDMHYTPTDSSLLGIYIPWKSLADYDMAKIGTTIYESVADPDDSRLMNIPLKDGNLVWNEDPEFDQNPFDTEGFANLGKVENTTLFYDEDEDDDKKEFELEYKTKTITLEDGSTKELQGYFITGYKGTDSTVVVPELVFNIDESYEERIVGIDGEVFKGINAETILIPDSIRYIGQEAFANNDSLTMIRFYETEYAEYEDEESSGLETEDGMQLNSAEERCGSTGGSWKDKGDGTYACAYSVPSEKETTQEDCDSLNGTFSEGICAYGREVFGETPEEDSDDEMNVTPEETPDVDEGEFEDSFAIMPLALGVSLPTVRMLEADPEVPNNSQLACEANAGTWDDENGTCISGDVEVDEDLDGGFDIEVDHRTNSQKACEVNGGTWNEMLGTCSTEQVVELNHDVYIDESAFDFTPNLTWIIAGENAWSIFDTAYILSEDKVKAQDEKLDGSLWWNPEALNPQTGKQGYWELGTDQPALLEHPITINHLVNEDPIDPGMTYPGELPQEITGIKADTLIEVIKTDKNGHAITQLDYPEGKYYVKEIVAPEGYTLNRTEYPIELKYQDLNNDEIITVKVNDGNPIVNEKAENHPLRIDIYKVDENTLKGLAGAEFQLWNYERTTVLETLVTDSKGHAITKGLYDADANDGHYWIKETKAPEGYEIIGDGWTEVTVDADAMAATTLVVVKNKPEKPEIPDEPHTPGGSTEKRIKIELIKSLEKDVLFGDTEAWKDVQFGIFAAEDIYTGSKRDPKLVYAKDELIFKSGIDENGILNVVWKNNEHDIEDGKYYVQEISTHDDYILNGHKYMFDYDKSEDGKYKVIEINDLKPIVNVLKRFNLQVNKVDEVTLETLSGAVMGLYATAEDATNNVNVLQTGISDENGFVFFDGLVPGTYFIKELEAPEGYQISDEIVSVEVDADAMITYKNAKTPVVKNPDTGIYTFESAFIVGILACAAALLMIFITTKND